MQIRALFFLLAAFSFAHTATSASSWVYSSGVYTWPGDFSYSASANYWDNSGGPIDGAYDVQVYVNSPWGAWQPYAPNMAFNSSGYTNFTFALKPTRANQTWQVYFTKTGNVSTGKTLNLASYGTATNGVWTTYTIPLSDFGVSDASIGSFAIQDTTGSGGNTWYVDNVGFDTPASTATAPTAPAVSSTVYNNGTFDWPGSFSYAVWLNYQDTTGAPANGTYDLEVGLTGKWGAWQPYAANFSFNSAPYTTLTFSLKPTNNGQVWQLYFMKVGDVPTGKILNIANYGPAPQVGKWATYNIPLADVGVLGTSIYKFAIQDESGLSSNVWYVNNVHFD